MKQTTPISRRTVRVALARADLKQWELAARLGISPSMLGDILARRRSASPAFVAKLNAILKKLDTTA